MLKEKKNYYTDISGIPIERIDLALTLYRIMVKTEISNYQTAGDFDEFGKIVKLLGKLQKKGFLTEGSMYSALDIIHTDISRSAAMTKLVTSEELKNKQGARENMPLNFLIYVLVQDSHFFTGKPNYRAISALLETKENIYITYEDVRKHFKRLRFEAVQAILWRYGLVEQRIFDTIHRANTSNSVKANAAFGAMIGFMLSIMSVRTPRT